MTVPPPDSRPAQDELTRLARENAALRAQLATWTDPSHALADAPEAPTFGLPTPSRARRWVGRAIAAALLAGGFGLGVWYANGARDAMVRGVRDGRAQARAGQVTEPAPTPPPRGAARP